ncbi:M3 family oligoendopeptidase [Clostridium frigidicarnis]|uniref:Oligoendopeptidase, pepF/M3 family n=1 Tax=Clostridium frigidicarnis TaxID=84698 RepID=A0A1I0V7W5_9CLOT|nr:M3 family oligoendopeptidase [Clostridium frigidicarnis]SFA72342.1 oligoendopeptidase, pepF/M3 family [Clostridium frigidicarnis]
MDLTWTLDNIYTSFDSENFKRDMEQLKKYIDSINELDIKNWDNKRNAVSKIEEFLKINNEYKRLYSMIHSYIYLTINADFQNKEAMDILDQLENENFKIIEKFIRFSRWLNDIENLDKIIYSSKYLSEHEFYIKELLLKAKYLLSEKEEVVFAKMNKTGAKAFENLYMELISDTTIDITINGIKEELTLPELRNIGYEKDYSLRKRAYYGEADLCKKISQVCAKCINGISGEASTIYEMRGYKSPLEKVLIDSRMDFETLNVMVSAIKESLPIFHKYYYKKSEILGHKSELPFYDIYAPIGDSNIKVSYMDAKNLIVSSFKTFSEKLGSFSKKAFENKWIDAEPRKGKANFGLSVDIFPIRESRIITNFNGNYIDISILAHELGHAYHSANLFDETMLNIEYPTPIAEVASTFCETILNNELLKTLPRDEALVILERSISDVAYYIVDFYGRYLFENELFERRKLGLLPVNELNELMSNCMKKAYGDSIESKTVHPYMWMNKVGYFMAGNEYLNFPYFFGVLFSKGLYAEYIKRGEAFVKQYDKFLSYSSKNNIIDVAKIMDIDVHSIDFWRNSLKLIEKDILNFINIG